MAKPATKFAATELPCILCDQVRPIKPSKAGNPTIYCEDCKALWMPEHESLCLGGFWIPRPVIVGHVPATHECPSCKSVLYQSRSKSVKNPGKAYIRCEGCDTFYFIGANYCVKQGVNISLLKKKQ